LGGYLYERVQLNDQMKIILWFKLIFIVIIFLTRCSSSKEGFYRNKKGKYKYWQSIILENGKFYMRVKGGLRPSLISGDYYFKKDSIKFVWSQGVLIKETWPYVEDSLTVFCSKNTIYMPPINHLFKGQLKFKRVNTFDLPCPHP
jgi:hypothetical protein